MQEVFYTEWVPPEIHHMEDLGEIFGHSKCACKKYLVPLIMTHHAVCVAFLAPIQNHQSFSLSWSHLHIDLDFHLHILTLSVSLYTPVWSLTALCSPLGTWVRFPLLNGKTGKLEDMAFRASHNLKAGSRTWLWLWWRTFQRSISIKSQDSINGWGLLIITSELSLLVETRATIYISYTLCRISKVLV